jgi:tripartite-type tricarboxylate transporter receptor subunit TctC
MKTMLSRTIGAVSLLAIGSFGWLSNGVAGEIKKPAGYPTRSIELSVPWGHGGSMDALARTLAPLMEERMGVGIGVVNRPGANSVLGLTHVVNQPADGYTLTGVTNDIFGSMAAGDTKLKVDDFVWLVRALPDIEMFFVRTDDKRFKTFDEYVAYAKAHPGKLIQAVAGKGGVEHTVASLVNKGAGITVKYVPYDAASERFAAFLGGHTDLLLEEPTDTKPYLDDGRARAIIQMIDKRPPSFPDVPTAREKGIDVTTGLWRGFALKAGTPKEIVDYVYAVIKDSMEDPRYLEFKKKRRQVRPDYKETPAEFKANAHKELEEFRAAIASMGK